jgi:predicted O-linked N-acetylglucosamine transferase (SPINDLY family)
MLRAMQQQLTLDQALAVAFQHHQAGRLADAEQVYRQILDQLPNHPHALHQLGVLALQTGRTNAAVELLDRAVTSAPASADAHCNRATALFAAGRTDDAIAAWRRAIELRPDFSDAHFNLGNALLQSGKGRDAVSAYTAALALKPDDGELRTTLLRALLDLGSLDEALALAAAGSAPLPVEAVESLTKLGNALMQQRRYDLAVAVYTRALQLNPEAIHTLNNLGGAYRELGKLDEAAAAFRSAIRLEPNFAEFYSNLGVTFAEQGKLDEAVSSLMTALQLDAANARAHGNLGVALTRQGQLDGAIRHCQRAVELQPDNPDARNNLAAAQADAGLLDDALNNWSKAVELKPDYPDAFDGLGYVLTLKGRLDDAVAAYERAIQLKPDYVAAHNNLGNAYKDRGELGQAMASFQRALDLKADDPTFRSNQLFLMHFDPAQDSQTIYAAHRQWNERYAAPLAPAIRPHLRDRTTQRRVRVGYVSPDLREHPIGRFLCPLLESHNREHFEVFCYSNVLAPDGLTAHLRAHTEHWRSIVGHTDDTVADLIRQDRIDILVDLSLHTGHNRLMVFARKPAPIQVTYLAYCSTSGMDAIDFRLSDPFFDPPDVDSSCYSEQTIRLPETYWCYKPFDEPTDVVQPPVIKNGYVTFGCFNNFCKVTRPMLETWCQLLHSLDGSRLILHAKDGTHRARVRELLASRGVDPERLTFIGYVKAADYFQLYNHIDIALDTFPFNGGTTTCDALHMGVPVISMAGRTAVSRAGLSVLSNVGLAELVADTPEQLETITLGVAQDTTRLANLRSTLRDRLRQSPLMNPARFALGVESAYRRMLDLTECRCS